jgi:hypothetical protein
MPYAVLRLQRAAGNGAVQRMLAPRPTRPRARPTLFVQRYEAGEHSQFGDVYEVKTDETVSQIATRFGLKSAELRAENKDKLVTWTTPEGKQVTGFNAGTTIIIPPPAPGAKPRSEDPQQLIVINTVTFTYGQVIALGDFYASPSDMHSAPVDELKELKRLLLLDEAAPGSVTTAQWQAATNGRYLTLSEDNAAHFAPSDPSLVPGGGNSAEDHKSEWEKLHRQALDAATTGNRDAAMATNAFGDHFLTDAFAAGHLFNKQDLMDHFARQLAGNPAAFFTAVANGAWADPGLATFMSGFETTDAFGFNINSADRFRRLLEGIHAERPDVVLNAVVKIVHDELNTNGVEVTNDAGSTWTLAGDKTLNAKSLEEGKRAVAQSQQNVLNVLASKNKKKPDYAELYAAVWAYVPRPTKAGATSIQQAVQELADPSQQSTIAGVVAGLIANIRDIVAELVRLGHLAPAGRW